MSYTHQAVDHNKDTKLNRSNTIYLLELEKSTLNLAISTKPVC